MKVRTILMIGFSFVFMGLSSPNSPGQTAPVRSSSRQTETLLIRIETKIDVLKDEAQRFADRNTGTDTPDQLGEYLDTLEQSATRLHETFDNRDPLTDDLRSVLTSATQIDQFLARNRVTPSAQSQWRSLKRDLTSLATSNRVSWNWRQPVSPTRTPADSGYPSETVSRPSYTVADAQVQTLLSRIDLKTRNYKTQMDAALRNDMSADLSDDVIAGYVSAFETAEMRLKQRFDSRQSSNIDATDVLTRATYIDQFMNRNRLNPQTQAQWRNLKADLNTLATYYSVSWNWNQVIPGTTVGSGNGGGLRNFDSMITGTYRLNANLSESPAAAIDRALSSSSATDRENYRTRLEQRLSSPAMIAIEKNNATVSIGSSILPQVTFQADGVARTETNARGRTITTTATADQDGVIINYQGERSSDFYVTFLPGSDGRLKVTRRIYLDNGNDSITVSSVYDKIDNVARWNMLNYSDGSTTAGGPASVNDSFVVPAGTRLSAELRSSISGNQANDRFTMEVISPGQYRGAVISGRVISEDAASRIAGRTRVLLAFDTIRLATGDSYRFAGDVEAVTATNGDIIGVSRQAVRTATNNQPTRGAGGILGALLGAIAGVPVDTAASSAAVAGTILTQNRNTIDIGSGSQVLITSSSTANLAVPR